LKSLSGGFLSLVLVLILTCNRLCPGEALGQESQPPANAIKQEQPPNESQWPDSMSDISAIEQRRIGKHELRATGEVKMRYQDMLLKADEVWEHPDAGC
jgi:lipopolysaccharide assembly outer membrane protein LptD (OstA)